MMIKAKDYSDFVELVHSSKDHNDNSGITFYSKKEVSPVSFTGKEPKMIRIQLVYCCSSFNLVFEKSYDKLEFEKNSIDSKIAKLKSTTSVKQFEQISIDYQKQLVTVHNAHIDL